MRLKSFQAKSMAEAMKQVREALGEDAIIVTTREEASGWVKVTAAVEQLPVAEEPKPAPKKEPVKTPTKATAEQEAARGVDPETIIEMITDTVLRHHIPANVGERIISTAMTVAGNDPQKVLAAALQKVFAFYPSHKNKNTLPIILVGPPGAGKTLMAAKLAARAVMNNQKPAVITTDIARAGGVEQLEAFLNILSLPLYQAETPKELRLALDKVKGKSPIIIDTGGLNPFDPKEMKDLAKLIQVTDMVPTLVLPAGIDADESAEMAMTFELIGVKQMLPTRLDFARRFGGILNAAARAGLGFSEASHTPQVADGILELTPEKLAQLLMPHSSKKG